MRPEEKNSIRVLCVSDDPRITGIIKTIFESWKDVITPVHESESHRALEMASDGQYDCVLIADGVSGCEAPELVSDFKSREVALPLIVLSSRGDEVHAVKTIKAGAYDYLPLAVIDHEENHGMLIDSLMTSISRSEQKAEKRKRQHALQISEERYRSLIEHSPILILRFFRDDNIINFVNDGFCKYFKVDRSHVLGEDLSVMLTDMGKESLLEKIRALADNDKVATFEMSSNVDGKALWQQWTVQAILNDKGVPVEYQCMGEDITGLKAANQKMNSTLDQISKLKVKQDGDYYLTSLMLEPLGRNLAASDTVLIDFFIRENKVFTFKKWNSSIGGDICYSHNIYLDGKIYIVFMNADAMGKSMQGAGGALVLGAVFQSIIDRTRFSPEEQYMHPEQWLKRSFLELQRVFEVFNGAMLISLVMGLVEENTGLMYFINAEHPLSVLYRGGRASFIESGRLQRKIGTQGANGIVAVQTVVLEDGDVIIAGSDGRDEILIEREGGRGRAVNQDENLFLKMVEKGSGNLGEIYDAICAAGEIRDDISFLRIGFRRVLPSGDNDSISGLLSRYRELKDAKDDSQAETLLEDALKRFGEHPLMLNQLMDHYFEMGDYEKTFRTAKKLIYLDSSDAENIYIASYSAMQAGYLRDAEDLAERVYLRDPGNLKNLAHFARILLANEKYSEAYSVINEIMAIDPENINALALQHELDLNMAIIKWNDRYRVNIVSIDEQHRGFIEMVNKLKRFLSRNEEYSAIKSILAEMKEYAKNHFDLEEKYMIDTNFPLYGEHKKEHEFFKSQIDRFQKYYYAGRAHLTAQMLTFLSSWLKDHLLGTDRKYIEHFRKAGIK